MTFVAICVTCGRQMNATNAHDDGWKLFIQPGKYRGHLVNAMCWRCDREKRASEMRHEDRKAIDAMKAER
jgi:hypothetical protein